MEWSIKQVGAALSALCLTVATLATVVPAAAQDYPDRPVTLIVPFAAAGPGDIIARLVAEAMRRSLGQEVIVVNMGGAGGTIGTARVAAAKPFDPAYPFVEKRERGQCGVSCSRADGALYDHALGGEERGCQAKAQQGQSEQIGQPEMFGVDDGNQQQPPAQDRTERTHGARIDQAGPKGDERACGDERLAERHDHSRQSLTEVRSAVFIYYSKQKS